MIDLGLKVFFSCSFKSEDEQIVDYFRALCEGLNMTCTNINRAAPRTPGKEAKEMIMTSDALIAIATRRKKTSNGMYDMPSSVQVEIGMACGLGKPALLFVENGVTVEGLADKIVVYDKFNRDELWNAAYLKKAVRSLYELREEAIFREQKATAYAASEYYSDLSDVLVTLKKSQGHYIWSYSGTRRLVFTQTPKYPIKLSAWASVPTKKTNEKESLKYRYRIDDSSKKFRLKTTSERQSPDAVRVSLEIKPNPKPDDYIVLSQYIESRYLNPVYMEDLAVKTPFVTLNSNRYFCGDGVLVTINTKVLKIMFNFPAEYGLSERSFEPFVGTVVGSNVLHVIKTEVERIKYDFTAYGDIVVPTLEVRNPMLLLMYGLAWNPPHRSRK